MASSSQPPQPPPLQRQCASKLCLPISAQNVFFCANMSPEDIYVNLKKCGEIVTKKEVCRCLQDGKNELDGKYNFPAFQEEINNELAR